MAVATYQSAMSHYPPAYVRGPDGRPWHSWRVLLLPYIEQDPLYKQYRFDEPWDSPHNLALADQMPKLFAFSGTKMPTAITNYLAVVGPETMWPGAEGRKHADVTDSASQTILIVENNGLGVRWTEPRDLAFDTMNFHLDHPDGVSSWYKDPAVVTADGTVRQLSRGMSADALRAALTVRGGEKINEGAGGWEVLPQGRMGEEPAGK